MIKVVVLLVLCVVYGGFAESTQEIADAKNYVVQIIDVIHQKGQASHRRFIKSIF